MNANQFRVVEHYSYDMIGVLMYEFRSREPHLNDYLEYNRLYASIVEAKTITLHRCRMYLFPDFKFDADEYANR